VFIEAGMDGLFADHPDLGREILSLMTK
jgi:glycerophosphoryl diester phosphodiesterase